MRNLRRFKRLLEKAGDLALVKRTPSTLASRSPSPASTLTNKGTSPASLKAPQRSARRYSDEDTELLRPANPLKGISAKVLRRNYGRQKGTPTQNLRYLWLNWAKGVDATMPNKNEPCFVLLRDGSWSVATYDEGTWTTVRNIISGQQVRKIPGEYIRAWSWLPMMTRGTRLTNKYLRDLYRKLEEDPDSDSPIDRSMSDRSW